MFQFRFFSDTSTNEYFSGKGGLSVPIDTVDFATRGLNSSQLSPQQRRPSLTKSDSVDIVDCEYRISIFNVHPTAIG